MAKFSHTKIRQFLSDSDTSSTSDLKGDKLEQLVVYLFSKIQGVTFHKKNVIDIPRAHEIDIVFNNDTRISDLYFLEYSILVECKNTSQSVGSIHVRWFIDKLRDRGKKVGILISLCGITGEKSGITSAYSEVLNGVVRDGVSILLINREEILSLKDSKDLVNLLQDKILALTIERTVI